MLSGQTTQAIHVLSFE